MARGTGIPRGGRVGCRTAFQAATAFLSSSEKVSYSFCVQILTVKFSFKCSLSHGFPVMHMRCFNITDKSQSILKQTTGHCLSKKLA